MRQSGPALALFMDSPVVVTIACGTLPVPRQFKSPDSISLLYIR